MTRHQPEEELDLYDWLIASVFLRHRRHSNPGTHICRFADRSATTAILRMEGKYAWISPKVGLCHTHESNLTSI